MSTPPDTIRVLHVDDEPDFADMAATFIEREDERFAIQTATSADEGLDRLRDDEFDCIISDYDMPGQNGIEFLRAIRESYPDLPFILYTGKGSEEVASEAISAGVTDYLQKESGTDQYTLLTNRIQNAVERERVKQERAEIRERMELALRETNSVTFEIDVETDDVSRQGAIEQFFDLPTQEIATKTGFAENAVHPDDRERFREFFQQLREGDQEYNVLDFRTHPNIEDVRWIRSHAHHIGTDGNEQIIGLAKDISAQKEREQTLRKRERRYQAIFNDPNVLTGVLDSDGTLLEVNQKALDYIEATEEAVTGELIWETPWWDAEIRKAVRRKVEQAADGEYTDYEADLTKPDGEPYSVTGLIRPVTDEDGEVTSLIISARDITERKERERELERYEAYLEESSDIITVLDESGTITYQSPAVERILGYDADELIGVNGFDLVHPDDLDEVYEVFTDLVAESGATVTVEYRFKTADDEWRWIEGRGTNRLEHDAIEGIVTNHRDITEQKERKRRYEAVFNNTYQFTGLLEPDGTLVEANKTALEFGGLDREDVIGKKLWEAYWFQHSEDTKDRARRAVEQAADGEFVRHELPVQGADREAIIDFSVRPVTDEQGNVTLLIPEGRDITEREERERELERTTQYLEIVLETAGPAFLKWADGRYQLMNTACKGVLGLDPDRDVTGLTDYDLFPDDVAEQFRADDQRVIEAGEPIEIEEEVPTADGTKTYQTNKRPLFDEEGTVEMICAVSTDITERKGRESELEAIKRQFDAVLTNTTTPMFMKDADGEYLFVNQEYRSLFDLQDEEIVGRTDHEIHPPAMADEIRKNDRAVIESGESVKTEERIVIDGMERLYLTTKVPIYDTGRQSHPDEPVAVFGVATDITERKEREQQLEQQNERLEEFASIVSHDLRNPLRVADGRLELIREECGSDHIDDVAQALDRMDALIEDLLTLAREGVEIGKVESVVLADLIEDTWQNIAAPDTEIVNTIDRTVRADRSRLQQLIENLMRNAVEHGDGDVTVTIGELDDGFYVEDDGPGISENERDDVFEAGYSTAEDGYGFGLSIVTKVAQAHGWDVGVTNGTDGGARFEITGVEFTAE